MAKKKNILKYIVLGAIFVLVVKVGWEIKNNIPSTNLENIVTTSSPPLLEAFMSQLDGTSVTSTEQIIPKVLGVVIDNHPDARPAAGISAARVVYEAPVEGGLTRFFAIFNTADEIPKVGPVRSARPYFLDWLSEYGNSSFWHAGGSPEALSLIKKYKIWDVNHFPSYFWRTSDRLAPHNLYTSSERWNNYFNSVKRDSYPWEGWQFEEFLDNAEKTETAKMQISYGNNYTVGWEYDKTSGKYFRIVNNKKQAEESGDEVYASTVIVQEMDVEIIDEEGRRKIGTIGEGKVRVLRDGELVRGEWRKPDRSSRTLFYDSNGAEIPLKPGKIWIQIVPQNTPIEVSN